MTILDDVKELEDGYNYAKERICELLGEKIEYGETIRRLTKSNEKLKSMLDLCESSCSECKKHIEVENLKNRIKNLESKLADREKLNDLKNGKLNASLSTIRELQEAKAYWHNRYQAQMIYCLGNCPNVPPK